jgi:YVTN family beta-propeller protein
MSAPPPPAPPNRNIATGRRRLLIGIVVVVFAFAVAVGFAWNLRGPGPGTPVRPSTIALPGGALPTHRIRVAGTPVQVLLAQGLVWVLCAYDDESVFSIVRIDPKLLQTVGRPFEIETPSTPEFSGMAVGEGSVWLSQPTLTGPSWDKEPGVVRRLDATTGKLLATIAVGHHPGGIVLGAGSVWVSSSVEDTVSRIDPATNALVATIPVGHYPNELTWGFGTLWVHNEFDVGSITRIDPDTNRVVAQVPNLGLPAMGDGVVWAVGPGSARGLVERLDPRTNEVVRGGYSLDIGPGYVAAGEGTVWIGKWYPDPTQTCPPGPFDCPFFGVFAYRRYDQLANALEGPSFAMSSGPNRMVIGDQALWAAPGTGRFVIRASLGA